MFSRIIIVSIIAALSACASLKKSDDGFDPANLPPSASGGEPPNVSQWNNIGGKAVRSLTRNVNYPDNAPSITRLTGSVDFVSSNANKFGRRIAAILIVPETGSYQFRLSADESAELWLSKDSTPANKRLLAFTNRPTGYKVWNKYKTQVSPSVELQSGDEYFIEILHKDHINDDYLLVEWAGPGGDFEALDSSNLFAYIEPDATTTEIDEAGASSSYATGYHAGYTSGMNLLGYDARYPLPDQDSDGLPDFYELLAGTDPNDISDALEDIDGDQLTNYDEYLLLSNPNNADTDGDSIPDGFEVAYGMALLDSSDSVLDLDGDGVTNLDEYLAGSLPNDPNDFPVGPVERVVTLSWDIPTQREDGSSLEPDDIQAFKIYSGPSQSQLTNVVEVGPYTTEHNSEPLQEGTYYFAISTVDADGVEGPKSSTIAVAIN